MLCRPPRSTLFPYTTLFRSNFDRRSIFNTSLVAESPGFGQGFLKQLTKDWQVSPIISLYSGQPINVTDSTDVSLDGDSTYTVDRPNVVSGVSLYPSPKTTTAL